MYDIEQGLKQMTINIMKKLLPISKSNAALSSRRRRVVFASLVCQPVLFDLDRARRGEERGKEKERANGRTGGQTRTSSGFRLDGRKEGRE